MLAWPQNPEGIQTKLYAAELFCTHPNAILPRLTTERFWLKALEICLGLSAAQILDQLLDHRRVLELADAPPDAPTSLHAERGLHFLVVCIRHQARDDIDGA